VSPWSVGDKLGPYELLAKIGQGGMGEVWKARDTRLDRMVAIKLSASKASTARALSAGSPRHPGAESSPHLPDLRRRPGLSGAEYIGGKPLRGPLPLADAIRVALQIAGRVGGGACEEHLASRSKTRQHPDDKRRR
jgi:eukaryotic-like serine/threonine-protein kinase